MADPRNSNRLTESARKLSEQRTRIGALADSAAAMSSASHFNSYRHYWEDDEEDETEMNAQPTASGSSGKGGGKDLSRYATKAQNPHTSAAHGSGEWDGDRYASEASDIKVDKEYERKDSDQGRTHELKRDEMQYRTALKTAFELGLKAGLMQRSEAPPCTACERRKERNRIAAQASRMEKRRLERGAPYQDRFSESSTETVHRTKRRLPTTGETPVPFTQEAPSFSNASVYAQHQHS